MRNFFRYLMAIALLLGCLAGQSEAARPRQRQQPEPTPREIPLTRETFRHAVTLDGEEGFVLSYVLPEAVYKGLELADFSDMCVFDADGNPVPFQMRSTGSASRDWKAEKEIPYFIWQPVKGGDSAPAKLDVEVNAEGGIVRIKGQGQTPPKAGPVSYILDMEQYLELLQAPANGFEPGHFREGHLTFSLAGDEAFMTSVTVQTSPDLSRWQTAGRAQVLARMRQGGDSLERNRIALPASLQRYVLLRMSDSEAPIVSVAATARFSRDTQEIRESILPGTLAENKRSVSYVLPGRFPVRAIGFDLPRPDVMAVRLQGSDDPDLPGREYRRGFVYRLDKDGASITSDPFSINTSRRYWTLAATGSIPFDGAPGMRVYWQPRELLFMARGQGPWTLAYGRDTPAAVASLPMLAEGGVKEAREIAVRVEPDTPPVAPPAAPPDPGNEWMLWAVLVLAVIFLSGITVWMVRSMKK